MDTNQLILGDSYIEVAKLKENSIDTIVTDPPYMIGFMGKDFDNPKDNIAGDFKFWKLCLRALKPGAFAFIMCSPRQDVLSRMIVAIQDAGFKTNFTSLYWTMASGFPKASNIGKMVDKKLGNKREVVDRNPNSRENCDKTNTLYESGTVGKTDYITKGNTELEGSYGGFQPKPAVEIILVAMKPLSEKTYVDQAMKNKKGITWLDDCRIPYDLQGNDLNDKICVCQENPIKLNVKSAKKKKSVNKHQSNNSAQENVDTNGLEKTLGKKQENIKQKKTILSLEETKDSIITKSSVNMSMSGKNTTEKYQKDKKFTTSTESSTTTESRICSVCHLPTTEDSISKGKKEEKSNAQGRFMANLICQDDVLNDKKTHKSSGNYKQSGNTEWYGGKSDFKHTMFNDSGSYSRYFDLDKWWEKNCPTFPFMIVPKASKSEKNWQTWDLGEKGGKANEITVRGNTNPVCQKCKGSKIDRGNGICQCKEPEYQAINKKQSNIHPTVKPLKLMSYLVKLGSREKDVILDPFMGSGTTCLAAKMLDRQYIGIEREKEYFEIAQARLKEIQQQLF